jgi:hypothetical protein
MGTMSDHADSGELAPALSELQDALARVRAQLHVLRLAISGGVRNEGDVRALLFQLGSIEDELQQAESMIGLQAGAK